MRFVGDVKSSFRRSSSRAVGCLANHVQALREDRLLTKAELARMAGISALTLARIERGQDCRVDTQRKILLALGLSPGDKARVFGGRGRRGRVVAAAPRSVAKGRRALRPRR